MLCELVNEILIVTLLHCQVGWVSEWCGHWLKNLSSRTFVMSYEITWHHTTSIWSRRWEEGEVEGTRLFSDWTADLFKKLRIVFQVHWASHRVQWGDQCAYNTVTWTGHHVVGGCMGGEMMWQGLWTTAFKNTRVNTNLICYSDVKLHGYWEKVKMLGKWSVLFYTL